jgi:predicted dehydrogenase
MQKSDGMNYAPKGKSAPVCRKGDFRVGVIGLDHGHIFGMCNGLVEAGAELAGVYDPDPAKVANFRKAFPGVSAVFSEEAILEDPSIHLVAGAAVPSDRCGLGLRVMDHGKDYFSDKPPFTTLDQIESARKKVAETGLKYAVYYSERLHVEAAIFAGNLIADGAIGRVVQVIGMGPHRISLPQRPEWFFQKEKTGGILVDLGCHQIEQFLFYSGAKDARVISATRPWSRTTARRTTCGSTGSRRTAWGSGATGGHSCSAPTGTSK